MSRPRKIFECINPAGAAARSALPAPEGRQVMASTTLATMRATIEERTAQRDGQAALTNQLAAALAELIKVAPGGPVREQAFAALAAYFSAPVFTREGDA